MDNISAQMKKCNLSYIVNALESVPGRRKSGKADVQVENGFDALKTKDLQQNLGLITLVKKGPECRTE